MQFTSERVGVAVEGEPPMARLERVASEGCWCVPFSPILFDAQIEWRRYVKSKQVLIPTFKYRTTGNPAVAFGFMVQVGLRAAAECPLGSISRIHLVYGDPVHQSQDDSGKTEFLVHIGLGFLSKE